MNVRTLILAVVTTAATAFASPALAQQQRAESMRIGAAVGSESSSPYRGLGVRLDFEIPGDMLGPKGGYAWVVSGGYSHMGRTMTIDPWYDEQESWRLDIYKIVPAFRLFVDPTQRLRFYGDVGIGVYRASYLYEWSSPTIWPYERKNDFEETSVLLRFAVGGAFALKPGFRLGGEIGFTNYLGDLDDSTFNGLVTVMWSL